MNNFTKYISNLTKRTISVLLVIYSYSCTNRILIEKSGESLDKLQEKSVQCVLQEFYKNTTKKTQNTVIVLVQKDAFYFKNGLGRSSKNFAFSRGILKDTISMKAIPKLKYVNEAKLLERPIPRETLGLEENFWRFSPMISTQSEDFYLIYSERNSNESVAVSLHLIRNKKNNRFEYLLPVNGYIIFY